MKQLLFALFLCCAGLTGYGQGLLPIPLNIKGYRGNPIQSDTIYLAPSDTLPGRAVVAARPAVGSGQTNPQPILVHKKLAYVIRFATSETLPELSTYELKVSGVVKYSGTVTVNKQQVVVFPLPGGAVLSAIYSQLASLQALYNSLANGQGNGSSQGSNSQTYPLSNVPPTGYLINHNKANRLVRATFFREDTGQPDALWRIVIETDNRVSVAGPPGETFSGRVALEFIIQPISN